MSNVIKIKIKQYIISNLDEVYDIIQFMISGICKSHENCSDCDYAKLCNVSDKYLEKKRKV